MKVSGKNAKDGEEAVELYYTLKLTEADKRDVCETFEKYCNPKRNVVYEWYAFFTRLQKKGERFEEFLTDMKKLAQLCEFGTV